jgi:hypothetical protein
MSIPQAMILGAMLALTPSVLMMTWAVWWDKLPPPPQQPEIERIEAMAAELRLFADRIIEPVASPDELAARLQLIGACRRVLAAAGYTFTIDEYRNVIIEDDNGRESKP